MRRHLPLAILMAAALPAQAGLFDDSEARNQIINMRNDYNARFDKLEASARSQIELANQIEQLKAEIAKLRGQIEVLTYEADATQKRQKDFYVDLDNRLRRIEAPPSAAADAPADGSAPRAAAAPADPAAEARDYEAALNLFKAAKYRDAVAGFEAFIKGHPSSSFLPSANFWAGNAALQLKEVVSATHYFKQVATSWPEDPRAPDALLGLATCQQSMGDEKAMRKTLDTIVQKYPGSTAAKTAKQRLGKG
ncbi:tol-pal system protein YbgF [Zoogloea sp.]|uniref:tol-pal system protein YbgF n=1 Tax=Zoogloea sp. TaxID=49181 RepID=UPI001A62BB61|nr:tol-pal system protein YbgF [Zoogloeaceae bacterium]